MAFRNVRPQPRAVDDDVDISEPEMQDGSNDDAADMENEGDASDGEMSAADQSDNEDEENYEQQISNVSFGALKQAQDTLSRKRKRGSDTTPDQEDKLGALRERLRRLKESKQKAGKKERGVVDTSRQDDNNNEIDSNSDSDSDTGPEEISKSRSSKHAPAAQSSKYQVTRKRQVVDVPKRVVRDPRFDALHQQSAHPGNSEKAYSFLRDYQKSEIEELKAAVKRTKNEDDKEKLKRKIGSMENRIKAKEAKEREQEILRKHRREEREKIQEGKNPYYLKKKDVKEKALVEKFKGMKSKEREKVIEKRRRKEGQKEKKRMPQARRAPVG